MKPFPSNLKHGMIALAVLFAAAVLPAMPGRAQPAIDRDWISKAHRDHPLVGRIWSTSQRAFVPRDTLDRAIVASRYLLLGEKHDNPDHHLLQAEFLGVRAGVGDHPTVVFEMIPRALGDTLAAYLARPDAAPAGIGAAVGWKKSGWPDWSIYRPIAETAFRHRLPIRPGGLANTTVRAVVRQGYAALGTAQETRWKLDQPLTGTAALRLAKILDASHCGLLPKAMAGPMIKAQRARDASMADAMIAGGGPAVLIAGDGHVRTDFGVAAFLAIRQPDASRLAVGIVEVDPEATRPGEYLARDGVFDFLVFTPAFDTSDHCAELKARMAEKSGKKKKP